MFAPSPVTNLNSCVPKPVKRRKYSNKRRRLECERLKEIVPTVADEQNVNEVKIIREAIKHITCLEEAVIRRLLQEPLDGYKIADVNSSASSYQSQQANSHLRTHPWLLRYVLDSRDMPDRLRTSNLADQYPHSSGSTPCYTDEDEDVHLLD
ncbi:hypothetical protein EG68_04195 [Paragonimus skrjabini miyazakii]|uniref:BHLH domain-containing protein n=1 Tax=Paragonimus skrjabini miyazakii TaxID=59628 RepID=A0A8S9YZT7_9TREM|nr:hypothetical protein EG68_04195 [Paragonimus skrjabini miyazakii]